MSKAPPGLHEHGITWPVLCKSEGSVQEGQKKDLKEKVITGLRVSRSQGYAMLRFCTFHQKSPNQLVSLDPHFPERKNTSFAFQVMLSFSPVRGTKLADISLALALVPQGCYKLFQFVAALLRAVTMVGNCHHAASFSLTQSCLHSLLCHIGCFPFALPPFSSKCSAGPEAMHGGYTSQELMGSEASEMLQPNHSQKGCYCCCLTVSAVEEAETLK